MAQLRELKKQQTRERISHVATLMFIERGFEQTTIADIAQAAGVSKMTVTNYFPRKEDLFFDAYEEVVDGPSRTVAERSPGESALAALRRKYLADCEAHAALLGRISPGFARLTVESPALRTRLREIYDQQEQALARTLIEEVGAEGVAPRVAAAQLSGVQRVLFHEARRRCEAGQDEEEFFTGLAAAAREAFGLLEPALGDYAVK
ncbi:TetR/AcrR family transcriptional regulator [Streptantibioticus rubrisoli]|uniref:TetR/AcrR family transcriptional regulator n=1 Tax=Streptantibioticus rubrisoli TaxID=1387313 RepID=A0ABT1PAI7_9ACTN|nr:TetR family transcriptional regulator [Streptantibioticus rubrisoli]MCQ4042374.1 TetR/AcrR family transcriptional regulator [Streptantibioticus rubrisoli]